MTSETASRTSEQIWAGQHGNRREHTPVAVSLRSGTRRGWLYDPSRRRTVALTESWIVVRTAAVQATERSRRLAAFVTQVNLNISWIGVSQVSLPAVSVYFCLRTSHTVLYRQADLECDGHCMRVVLLLRLTIRHRKCKKTLRNVSRSSLLVAEFHSCNAHL